MGSLLFKASSCASRGLMAQKKSLLAGAERTGQGGKLGGDLRGNRFSDCAGLRGLQCANQNVRVGVAGKKLRRRQTELETERTRSFFKAGTARNRTTSSRTTAKTTRCAATSISQIVTSHPLQKIAFLGR